MKLGFRTGTISPIALQHSWTGQIGGCLCKLGERSLEASMLWKRLEKPAAGPLSPLALIRCYRTLSEDTPAKQGGRSR